MTVLIALAAAALSGPTWRLVPNQKACLVISPDGGSKVIPVEKLTLGDHKIQTDPEKGQLGPVVIQGTMMFATFCKREEETKFCYVREDGELAEALDPPSEFRPEGLVSSQDGWVFAWGEQAGKRTLYRYENVKWTQVGEMKEDVVQVAKRLVTRPQPLTGWQRESGATLIFRDIDKADTLFDPKSPLEAVFFGPEDIPAGADGRMAVVNVAPYNKFAVVHFRGEGKEPILAVYNIRGSLAGWAELPDIGNDAGWEEVYGRVALVTVDRWATILPDGTLRVRTLKPVESFPR
ncbi:MAG: hypothetical protein KIT11_02310 [Fimbriimonadaceae bacterium]|nr:hypothetical protein [Fimbriimonadaceae bacterium]QYK54798.1 MAG: hypothetical protein KF733_07225 [Fimbriimonadaceae bacterium]